MARRRSDDDEPDGDVMPEHLRVFRAGDWPDVAPMIASIRWQYARSAWRRAHGLPGWQPREVVDRTGR